MNISIRAKRVAIFLSACLLVIVAFLFGKYSDTSLIDEDITSSTQKHLEDGTIMEVESSDVNKGFNDGESHGSGVLKKNAKDGSSNTNALYRKVIRDEHAKAVTKEDKEFYETAEQVAMNRVSNEFQSHADFKEAFKNDKYDPKWSANTESEIDSILEQNNKNIFEKSSLNNRECRTNFCEITFTHTTSDPQEIKKIQGAIAYTLGNNSDINNHRQFINFLDEEQMVSYIYLERCQSCE